MPGARLAHLAVIFRRIEIKPRQRNRPATSHAKAKCSSLHTVQRFLNPCQLQILDIRLSSSLHRCAKGLALKTFWAGRSYGKIVQVLIH